MSIVIGSRCSVGDFDIHHERLDTQLGLSILSRKPIWTFSGKIEVTSSARVKWAGYPKHKMIKISTFGEEAETGLRPGTTWSNVLVPADDFGMLRDHPHPHYQEFRMPSHMYGDGE